MIYGEPLDISEKDLNTIYILNDQEKNYHFEVVVNDDVWVKYYDGSQHFRRQCLLKGYYLTQLIPVYHQGWELDEWAANAIKNGKKYFLTTDHGALRAEEYISIYDTTINYIKNWLKKIKL